MTDEAQVAVHATIRAGVAELLLQWVEETHGNDFGHDHHCPLDSFPKDGPWVAPPGDPRVCTCGWAAFLTAYNAMQRAILTKGTKP